MATLWARTVTFENVSVGDQLPVVIKWETKDTIERYNSILLAADPDAETDEISEILNPIKLTDYVKESLLKGFPPASLDHPSSTLEVQVNLEVNAEDIISIEGVVTKKETAGGSNTVECAVVIERQDKEIVATATAIMGFTS
jgi:hypothetical protein